MPVIAKLLLIDEELNLDECYKLLQDLVLLGYVVVVGDAASHWVQGNPSNVNGEDLLRLSSITIIQQREVKSGE